MIEQKHKLRLQAKTQADTCPHLCEYCFANASKEVALKNIKQHEKNPSEETITEIRTPNTNSSVMTDDKSAAMIADFQNTKNQIDRK